MHELCPPGLGKINKQLYCWEMENETKENMDFSRPKIGRLDLNLADLLEAHIGIRTKIATCDLASLAASVSGLLTSPEWQASTFRLEVLQHTVVAYARGHAEPTRSDFKSWLTELGQGYAGLLEDPSEGLFATRVLAAGGNFVIFEGLFEAATFHLQRFLNILAHMPDNGPFAKAKRSILALLRISDEVARRSATTPFMTGQTIPLSEVPMKLVRQIQHRASRAAFTTRELAALGLTLNDLEPFIFNPNDAEVLLDVQIGHSNLERSPLILVEEKLILALPAAVSAAIRRFLMEFCASERLLPILNASCARQLSDLFSQTPLAGGSMGPELFFQVRDGIHFANIAKFADPGRLLHICFVLDDFLGYSEGGLISPNPGSDRIGVVVQESLFQVHADMSGRDEFRDAISLIVICSWGRPVVMKFAGLDDERWRIQTIPAADFETMSWTSSFEPLSLWRLLDSRDRLRSMNLNVVNVNGLLNLQGWAASLRGHLVPHASLPEDHDPSEIIHFVIPQNNHLELRRRAAEYWNIHYARTWDGRNVRVRRSGEDTYFEDDRNQPLYVSMEDLHQHQRLAAVYETDKRNWWVTTEPSQSVDRDFQYKLFHALTVWLQRAAPVLDEALVSLPSGPFGWVCSFEGDGLSDVTAIVPNREQALALLILSVEGKTIRVHGREGFLMSFRNPTNVGETLLVETLIRGANIISGREEFECIEKLRAQIIPDEWARDIHLFTARQFRDFVRPSIKRKLVSITDEDSAYSKLGLGWRARERNEGAWIRGVDQCCKYLNDVTASVWEDMRKTLKVHNREAIIFRLFENHEATMIETDQWLRTARSVLSLHKHKKQTEAESTMRLSELNASSLASRLLIEMALCECPDWGVEQIGNLDLARLLTNAMQMHTLGGWSEAIKYGGKKAEIKISPLGDILSELDFDDTIATPYGQALGAKRLRRGAKGYEKNFNDSVVAKSIEDAFPVPFWNAWKETFGFTIDEMRTFLDILEDEGIRREMFAFICTQDELVAADRTAKLSQHTLGLIVEALTLRPRAKWDSTPPGFSPKDWYPWRYRRRLSLVARPIVELPGAYPRYLIEPSMIRNSAMKIIRYCLEGGFDAKDFPPGQMRSWIGAAENKRGHDFNAQVASTLRELGWLARSDIRLTEILNSKLDKDYGDVDVLAWKGNRILAIECKDLELAMTIGEIARQVHDFRGENVCGKPDRLKKHLNRCEVLQSRICDVQRFTKSRTDARLEMCLAFSDIVPMNFTDLARKQRVRIVLADGLDQI